MRIPGLLKLVPGWSQKIFSDHETIINAKSCAEVKGCILPIGALIQSDKKCATRDSTCCVSWQTLSHRARSCAGRLSAFSYWSVTVLGFVLDFFLPFILSLNNLFSSFKMCLYCTDCASLRQRLFTSPGLQSLIPIAKESSQEFICFLGTTANKTFVF